MSTTELNTTTHGTSTSTRERALVLLGQGISVDATAAACGVSAGAISQLLSMDDFAAAVAERRFHALEKHNKQDSEYDTIEETLTTKFKESIPLMMKPMEILKGLQVINAQKRRGASAPESIHDKQTVVSISLPAIILNNFANTAVETNLHNQVVRVGDKDLTTMQSGTLLNIHKSASAEKELLNATSTPALPTKLARTKRDPTDI